MQIKPLKVGESFSVISMKDVIKNNFTVEINHFKKMKGQKKWTPFVFLGEKKDLVGAVLFYTVF